MRESSEDAARRWLEPALTLLVFAVSVSYLAELPLHLYHQDEAHYLHEAKRLVAGDRLYLDIFELTAPGWLYLMAVLFKVFGVTLSTARITAAVIHASAAALLFIICRHLGVRRGLALACAATYLFVCPSTYPVASQHWLATLLGVVALLLCLRPPGVGVHFGLGLAVGLGIAVHQARGGAMGLGVLSVLVLDTFLLRHTNRTSRRALWLAFGAGLFIAVVPPFGIAMARAGVDAVWQALVVHPLHHYAGVFTAPWGWSGSVGWSGGRAFSLRQPLKYLPLGVVCLVPGVAGLWRSGSDRTRGRACTVLILLSLAAIYSVWYFPDFIHLAFIAPLFLVAIADAAERALRRVPRPIQVGVGGVATVAILGAIGFLLTSDLVAQSARQTTDYQSAFGPVEIAPLWQTRYTKLANLLDAAPSRTLYCHPNSGYTYLLVGADNPTRFEFVQFPYNTPEQINEVVRVLRTKEVPYVVMNPRPRPGDQISDAVREHYELVPDDALRRWGVWQLRRP